jgi:hypothetical protein
MEQNVSVAERSKLFAEKRRMRKPQPISFSKEEEEDWDKPYNHKERPPKVWSSVEKNEKKPNGEESSRNELSCTFPKSRLDEKVTTTKCTVGEEEMEYVHMGIQIMRDIECGN